jgi:hypothetical protein
MTDGFNKSTLFDPSVFRLFCHSEEVVEVRIVKVYGKSLAWGNEFAKGTVSGYFDDHEAFCKAVKEADKFKHSGIYFTLQVIDPRLIGRAFNHLRPAEVTTSDANVIAHRWLPIDLDPVRPSGISSSDSELKEALNLREEVVAWIVDKMDFSLPIKAVSGNGGHLLFRLAVQPHVDIRRAGGLVGPASLFLLSIADSGERKSSIDDFFLKPLTQFQSEGDEPARGKRWSTRQLGGTGFLFA